MAKKPRVIQEILRNSKITEYLREKGIEPVSDAGGRWKYLCPLHEERTPSFFVYEEKEVQHCKCFGCGFFGDIINVKMAFEKRSQGQVIFDLAEGHSLGNDTLLMDEIGEMEADIEGIRKQQHAAMLSDLGGLAYKLNRSMYDYLSVVGFDQAEVAFIDKVGEKIDRAVQSMDTGAMQILCDAIPEQLAKRAKRHHKLREENLAINYRREMAI